MLCIVKFVDVFHVEDLKPILSRQELAFGNYAPKRFAWEFEVMHVFDPPIVTPGQQGIFEWEIPAENGDTEELQPVTVALPDLMPRQLRLF